jgi:hypothetical protein
MSKQTIRAEPRDRTRSGGASLVDVRPLDCKPQTAVLVGSGERDMGLIYSAIREWIVPALVREFLAEHPIPTSPSTVISEKRTTKPLGKEGAGPTRINPDAQ